MSKQAKNMSFDTGLVINSLEHDEIKKLESCIDLLVAVTNSLKTELSNTSDNMHYIRCAKTIQGNTEAIHKLTVSIYKMKLKERSASEKDISPNDWESL